ncbi:MAG: 30S ribosomal protein S6e [Euryarchaeota archaeon]|nr:30S ribosomal protein S6e [Euryarchaeota archaeon]
MPAFKVVISDPTTGKAYQTELSGPSATRLVGAKVGETIDGKALGLAGYKLQVTGGTDKDGFPIRPDIHGSGRPSVVLSKPPTFYPSKKGMRKRKTVRGNIISEEIVQVNIKVLEKGEKALEELFGKKEEQKSKGK